VVVPGPPPRASNSCSLLRLVESYQLALGCRTYQLALGCASGVRLDYACPYQGESRRSGPRGRALKPGIHLVSRSLHLSPAPDQEVSLPPAWPLLRSCQWQKRVSGALAGGQLPSAAATLSCTYSRAPAPLRRLLARTHARDVATYPSFQTRAVITGGAALQGSHC